MSYAVKAENRRLYNSLLRYRTTVIMKATDGKKGALNLSDIIISFVLSVFASTALFMSYNPLFQTASYIQATYDPSCFLVIGRGLLEGKTPYLDFFDNKGLITYLINAIPQLFTSSILANYIVIFLFLFFDLLIVRYIGNKCEMKYKIFAQVITCFFLAALEGCGGFSEEYSLTFILAVFALVVSYSENANCQMSFKYGFFTGLLFALAALTRYNNAIPIAAVAATLAVYLICKKDFKALIKCALSFLCGAGPVFAAVFGYLAYKGALYECIYQTLLINLKYVEPKDSFTLSSESNGYNIVLLVFFITGIVGAAVMFFRSAKGDRRRLLGICTAVSALFCFLTGLFFKYETLRYLIINMPPSIIGIILLNSHIKEEKPLNIRALKLNPAAGLKILLTVFLSILICFNVKTLQHLFDSVRRGAGTYTALYEVINGELSIPTEEVVAVRKMAEIIPEEEKDSIFSVTANPCWYMWTDTLPCKRLFICSSLFMSMSEEIQNEMIGYFDGEDKPKWFVTAIPIDSFGNQLLRETIIDKYELVDEVPDCFLLYKLK